MKKTIIAIVMLMMATLIISGCLTSQPIPDPNQVPTPPPQPSQVEHGAKITHKTYGAFTLPEFAVQELVITETTAVLATYDYEGKVTNRATKSLTGAEYNNIIDVMNVNSFMLLDDIYVPQVGDPIVADTGNLEITVEQQGPGKKVEVMPYFEDYMPQRLRNVDTMLLNLKTELFDSFLVPGTDFIEIRFQSMQCEKTPWQQWYEEGKIQYFKEPTDAELIVDYYATEFNIQIKNAIKVTQEDIVTCEACYVCATSYYFIANVEVENLAVLLDQGWTKQKSNNEGISHFKFRPIQCETTPWTDWNDDNKPNQDNELLIAKYYEEVRGFSFLGLHTVTPQGVTSCSACGCSAIKYFVATVQTENGNTLTEDGWSKI